VVSGTSCHRREEADDVAPLRRSAGQDSDLNRALETSIRRVERWVEARHYKGYEPFDGLSSYLRPLACGNVLLERLLMQAVRQSPINLRPLLGIPTLESTKGRGYMAAGYLLMLRTTRRDDYESKARQCLDWLIQARSQRYSHFCWSNHFDFVSRGGSYSKQDPIIVWTALIGQAFLDAYEILHEEKYLAVARSVSEWILQLPRHRTSSGSCLSYFAFKGAYIHNANMLGAALLARAGKILQNPQYMEVAAEAMRYTCTRQLSNGAWYYGEEPKYRWIDNFHTAYNLDSLKCYVDSVDDRTFENNLTRGFDYFISAFFTPDGTPKYYHNRTFPIDIQCAAQAIETLANFSDRHSSSLELASHVARWTIVNMQDDAGYFYYRRYPLVIARTPMLHWGQATMYKGLATLMSKLRYGSPWDD
jgi:hypothetical protein